MLRAVAARALALAAGAACATAFQDAVCASESAGHGETVTLSDARSAAFAGGFLILLSRSGRVLKYHLEDLSEAPSEWDRPRGDGRILCTNAESMLTSSAKAPNTVDVWNLTATDPGPKKLIDTNGEAWSAGMTASGSHALLQCGTEMSGWQTRLVDLKSGESRTLFEDEYAPSSQCLSQDGSKVFQVVDDKLEVWSGKDRKRTKTVTVPGLDFLSGGALTCSPSGHKVLLLIGGSNDLALFDSDLMLVKRWHGGDGVFRGSAHFSDDGHLAMTVADRGIDKSVMRVWDLNNHQLVVDRVIPHSRIDDFEISRDGNFVFVQIRDKVHVWDRRKA